MSDDERDWFDKDEDEFVQEVQRKISELTNGEMFAKKKCLTNKEHPDKGMAKQDVKIAHDFFNKLQKISQMAAVERLLTISQGNYDLIKTFDKMNIPQYILLGVIKIVLKILNFPLCEELKDFMVILAENNFFEKIEKMLWLSVCGANTMNENKFTNAIESIFVICQHYIRLDITISRFKKFLESIEKVLRLKQKNESYKFVEKFVELSTELQLKETRDKEVYPTMEELHNRKVMMPELTEAAVCSTVDSYINSQISLIRNDVVDDIKRKIYNTRSTNKNQKCISIYTKARFLIKDDLDLSVNIHRMISVRIEEQEDSGDEEDCADKKICKLEYDFSPGSILLFTTNLDFEDLIIAGISGEYNQSQMHVKILKIYGKPIIFDTTFVMFKCRPGFQLCHNISKMFNRLNNYNFPIKSFLIHDDNSISEDTALNRQRIPAYLYEQLSSNLLQNQSNDTQISLVLEPLAPNENYDELKMIDTLINTMNKQVLVVCYSNNVLDEFLLKIVKNCTRNIVRMGNRSKYEELNQYNMKSFNEKSIIPNCFDYTDNIRWEYFAELKKISEVRKRGCSKYDKILYSQEKLIRLMEKFGEYQQMKNYYLLKNKKIIGMTSSYALICNFFVQLLDAPIVIIKDACMPEFHTISTLTKTTEQLILFEGKRNCNHKFLFDRLLPDIKKKICLTKNCKIHRNIQQVRQPHIYMCSSNLEYVPNIRGMEKDIFFVNYDSKTSDSESDLEDSPDVYYKFEVEMLFDLAKYILKQGYKPSDIVIIAASKKQKQIIDQVRNVCPELNEIKTSKIVDTIHKKKIILFPISLKNYKKIGKNIRNILSCVKPGFYAVGNIGNLAEKTPIWKEIKETLDAQGALGICFPMKCENQENLQIKDPKLPDKKLRRNSKKSLK